MSPPKPNPKVPQRKKTGLDQKYMEDGGGFEKRASKMQRRREVTGETSIYSRMQPFDQPEIVALHHKRIDYLFTFNEGTSDEELC